MVTVFFLSYNIENNYIVFIADFTFYAFIVGINVYGHIIVIFLGDSSILDKQY